MIKRKIVILAACLSLLVLCISVLPKILYGTAGVSHKPIRPYKDSDVIFWVADSGFSFRLYPDLVTNPNRQLLVFSPISWRIEQCVEIINSVEDLVVAEFWGFPFPCFLAIYEVDDLKNQVAGERLPFSFDGIVYHMLFLNILIISCVFSVLVRVFGLASRTFGVGRKTADGGLD